MSKSAEQIALMYGDRYKDFQPLTDIERQDILRTEIGYALGEDTLGLGRLRERYAAKMAATPDARAFAIVSAPLGTSGAEFGARAHAAASVDTLDFPARNESALPGIRGDFATRLLAAARGQAGTCRRAQRIGAAAADPPRRTGAGRTAETRVGAHGTALRAEGVVGIDPSQYATCRGL